MILPNKGPAENNQTKGIAAPPHAKTGASAGARLATELFGGRYGAGQRLDLRAVAAEYNIELELVLKAFAEFRSLGMVRRFIRRRSFFKPEGDARSL
jgi:DNA-binding GntR family transcriptional regulator